MSQKISCVKSGKKNEVTYRKTGVSVYNDNPLIEALPKILSEKEAITALSHYPKFDENDRKAPNHLRYHIIQNNLKFFSALDINLDLEKRISMMIRSGYTGRNPFKLGIWKETEERLKNLESLNRNQYNFSTNYKSTAAFGFNIIGISGIGKSQTIEQILRLYPQVIYHNRYKEQNFTQTQIVWMKMDCPFDGSIKGLCYNFFISVDNILQTNYFDHYVNDKQTVDQLLLKVARVAANHFLGVLVIDEIQRLSKAKSGGEQKMLDFFVQLVNTIGVPVVLIGTFKALPLFSGSLSQMRRGAGQGDLVWDRMEFNEQWKLFVEDLWKYQYLQKVSDLSKNQHLSKVLYEECQGITDLAIKLFMFSQELAISSGKEEITASIIRSAAKSKFNLLQAVLKALKNKDKQALNQFEDAYPLFLDDIANKDSKLPFFIDENLNETEMKLDLTSHFTTNKENSEVRA